MSLEAPVPARRLDVPTLIRAAGVASWIVWRVNNEALHSRFRESWALPAKFALYHAMVVDCRLSAAEAGRVLNRQHGTIISGIRSLIAWAETNPAIAAQWRQFRSLLPQAIP